MAKNVIINVNFKNKFGSVTVVQMSLKQYLMAKKVMPNSYEPADDHAKKLAAQIPLDVVPSGTTLKDVKEFEQTRGHNKGKVKTDFEKLLDAVQKGADVTDYNEEVEDEIPNSGNIKMSVPDVFKDVAEPPEFNSGVDLNSKKIELDLDADDGEVTFVEPGPQHKSIFSKEDLLQMSSDQLDAIIGTLTIPDSLKKGIKAIKNTREKVEQIEQITKVKA